MGIVGHIVLFVPLLHKIHHKLIFDDIHLTDFNIFNFYFDEIIA